MIASAAFRRMARGRAARPNISPRRSFVQSSPMRPDRPLNAREFHEEIVGHLDRDISVASGEGQVFELHRRALDRIIEKFDPRRAALFRIKSGWDALISDLQSSVATFAGARCSQSASLPCRRDRLDEKQGELDNAIVKLREVVPSLSDEIVELRAALVGMKRAVAEQSAAADAERQSLEQAKDLLGSLGARLCRNRKKREAAAEELAEIQQKWDATASDLMRRLESTCGMGKAIEAKKRDIAGLRKSETQFIVVRTTGVEEQRRNLRQDIAEIRSETERIKGEIAALERVIQAERIGLPRDAVEAAV
jgi:chromosome segregation ATPase